MQIKPVIKNDFWLAGQAQFKRNALCQPYDLVKYLKSLSTSRRRNFVFDLGAGQGANLNCLLGKGKSNVLALDIDPTLDKNLPSVVRRKVKIVKFTSIESTSEILINSPFASVAFQCADITQCQLPSGVADGVVLHRVLSVITDPVIRSSLLESICQTLKPGGMLSFLDFLINNEISPTVTKQYELGRELVKCQMVLGGPPLSTLTDPEASILAILMQKDGKITTTGRADEQVSETLEKIREGEISVTSFAIQLTPQGYIDLLSTAGFRIINNKFVKIPALDPAYQVRVIRILAQKPQGKNSA